MLIQAAPTRTETKVKPALLFVDDERRVLTSMRAMFRRDYDVVLANSGDEAVEVLRGRDDIHVVVSDQRMPGMTGVELLAQVKEEYPSSMRILLTGYADLEAVEASINESEVFRYLMKPCPTDELRDAIRLAVQAARVSELAGVDELAAVPDEDLEKIELVDVDADPNRVVEAIVDDASLAEVADTIEVVELPMVVNTSADGQLSFVETNEPANSRTTPAPVSGKGPALEGADSQLQKLQLADAEVLVLSRDPELLEGVTLAIGPQYPVRDADSIDSALRILSEHPVGVLITDLAVDEAEIDELTRTLKQEVPELVTIIASDRSDASLLIGLINHGQIFRFLLKPLQVAQTRIWLTSAMVKYAELCANSNKVLRHRVAPSVDPMKSATELLANVRGRIQTIKKRFSASLQKSLKGVRGE